MQDRVKMCYACERSRGIDSFNRDSGRKDGLQSKCRDCQKQHYEENRQRHSKVMATWYQKNRESALASQKAYRERTTEYQREKNRRWVQANPEKNRAKRARRRALEVGDVDYNLVLDREGYWCYLCETTIDSQLSFPHPYSLVFEHVVALSKGGIHDNSNLKVAHNRCNLIKGAK